jgi:hypothetical protein
LEAPPAVEAAQAEAVAEAKSEAEAEAGAEAEAPILPPALWHDPDLRWLTGVHEAEGHSYLIRERYEELLWWLLLPALLRLAGAPSADRAATEAFALRIGEALAAAESAGYSIEGLAGSASRPVAELAPATSPVQADSELL